MSFLPPVVGCLLKTWLTEGGHRHPRTPVDGHYGLIVSPQMNTIASSNQFKPMSENRRKFSGEL